MGLGRLCHFFLEIAKSKSPRQGIFIYVLYDYWGQCLSEFSYVVSSSLIWIGVPFLTGVKFDEELKCYFAKNTSCK